ncbi:MAG: hypothetical protein Q9203_006808 [Teloschistes exilis]
MPCPGDLSATHATDFVMSIDGACRGNGTGTARSSSGVHFAKNSPHNFNGIIPGAKHTSQRAELMAYKKGLGAVELLQILYYTTECEVHGMEAPVQVLVVKSDSAYLVNSMTEYIDRWRKNGYKNVKGTAVANADLFVKIDKQINFLDDLNTTVSFWHVPRMRNREADSLANDALDGKLVGGDLDYD